MYYEHECQTEKLSFSRPLVSPSLKAALDKWVAMMPENTNYWSAIRYALTIFFILVGLMDEQKCMSIPVKGILKDIRKQHQMQDEPEAQIINIAGVRR